MSPSANGIDFAKLFRKPSPTAPGQFHLREEFLPLFTPFFWHYTKAQMSEAEKNQRTVRQNNASLAIRALAPPPATFVPPMRAAYANILRLLDSYPLMHMCVVALARYEMKQRTSSYAMAHRVKRFVYITLCKQNISRLLICCRWHSQRNSLLQHR